MKKCGVLLDSIKASISFDIYIENNKSEKFKTSVFIDIPYELEGKTLYDGRILERRNTNITFYRYE